MVVNLFVPCYIDQFYPQTAFNAIRLLKECDIEVNYNPHQTCCGKIAFEAGFRDEAKELGEKFIQEFNNGNPIVGLSVSCVAYIQNRFKNLFYNSGRHLEYKQIENNIYTIEDFLVNIANRTSFGATFEGKAMYHDTCIPPGNTKNDMFSDARKLLDNVAGLNLVEFYDQDNCCGTSNIFPTKYSAISSALAAERVNQMKQHNIETIIVSDCNCWMNLESYIKKNGDPINVTHIVDVLSSF